MEIFIFARRNFARYIDFLMFINLILILSTDFKYLDKSVFLWI